MKILFLHLSDIHSEDDTSLDNIKLDKMIDAIKVVKDVDECILICSGDLAYSGQANEYKSVRHFLGKLLSNIGKEINGKFIHTLIVPGNHDMCFPNNIRNCEDILSYYSNNTVSSKYTEELDMLKNFMEYAKSKKCFKDNMICDTKLINLGDFTIQANLLNTAPFSTKKNDNKELHYLPEESLYSLIKKDCTTLSITVMHHSTEWFNWDTKEPLENIIYNNSEIIFQGHEHIINTVNIKKSVEHSIIISKGGEYSGKMTHKSTFSALVLNTESFECSETSFEWNSEKCMFVNQTILSNHRIIPKTIKLTPTKEFTKAFYMDKQGLSDKSIDYFIFPKLTPKNKATIEDKNKVINEQSFLKQLFELHMINIVGKSSGGKTAFLKYLYNKSLEIGLTPLYLGSEDYKPKRIDKIIKDLFEEQYGEDELDFKRFEQLDKSKKIVLIDDFDCISNAKCRESLLKYFCIMWDMLYLQQKIALI